MGTRTGTARHGTCTIAIVWSVLILVAGVLFSAALGWDTAQSQRQSLDDAMDRRAALAASAVTTEIGRYVDTLRTVAGSLGAFDQFTAAQFTQVAQPLTQSKLAGVSALGFVVPSDPSRVAATQQAWLDRGAHGLVLTPKPGAPEHYFTVLSRTLDGSGESAVGVDIAQAAAPTSALVASRRSGKVTVSAAYHLIRDKDLPPGQQQWSFVLAAPVYGAAGGDGAFRGWAVMGLRGQSFVGATLNRVSEHMYDITLVAGVDGGNPSQVAMLHATSVGMRDLHRRTDVAVAQQRWQLYLDASAADLLGPHRSPTSTAVTGSALSLLLALLIFILTTSRARAGKLVAAATAELQQQKADMTTFASVVAHDLQTPLTSVRGYTEMIEDELGKPAPETAAIRGMLNRISNATTRMRTLIGDLQSHSIARDADLQLEDVDLRAIADSVAGTRIDLAGATGDPVPAFSIGGLPAVHADAGMTRQLINRLVSNALKYTAPAETPQIDITGETTADGKVRIHIADRGIGIPEGQHEAVFADFYRAHPKVSGSGLGLSICRRIVERHGGLISAAPNAGGGTRITFTLPRAKKSVPTAAVPSPGGGAQTSDDATVLP